MAKTFLIEDVDDSAFVPVVSPVWCKKLYVRQTAGDITQVNYLLAAPSQDDEPFPMNQAERAEFGGGPFPQNAIQAGEVVGYIKTMDGTADFTGLCEP